MWGSSGVRPQTRSSSWSPGSPGPAAGMARTLCVQDPPVDLRPEQLERWCGLEPSTLLMLTGLWVPGKALRSVCAGLHGCVRARVICVRACVCAHSASLLPAPGDVGLQQSCVPRAGTGRVVESCNHEGWKRPIRSSSPIVNPTPPYLLNHVLKKNPPGPCNLLDSAISFFF